MKHKGYYKSKSGFKAHRFQTATNLVKCNILSLSTSPTIAFIQCCVPFLFYRLRNSIIFYNIGNLLIFIKREEQEQELYRLLWLL